jgi:hypothetical protein
MTTDPLFRQALREMLGVRRIKYPGIKLYALSIAVLFGVSAMVVVFTILLHRWWPLVPVIDYWTAFLLTALYRIDMALLKLIAKSANTYAEAGKRQADMRRGGSK